jgi:hypothetical protein
VAFTFECLFNGIFCSAPAILLLLLLDGKNFLGVWQRNMPSWERNAKKLGLNVFVYF